MNSLIVAENLKNELDALRPFDAEAEARFMQKFRLDWNYHSNNVEGNSLTYGETKALILFGVTAQGKPLKDHFEITGHNEAINWIFGLVKNKKPLTEKSILKMHALLVKKSGGKYKSQPNHVSTVTGETFYFAAPQETPAKTRELIEWFGAERKKADVNPIILAAVFHHRFISIHPFEEGSGIVARLLMNFILMQFDYPPAIFETEDKENYFAALRRADVGELEPLSDYVAQNLARSLETLIRGAKGEGVKEPDDFDKELALLKEKVRNVGKTVEISKNREVMLEIFEDSIKPLISKFIEVCRKFDDFYIKNHLFLVWDNAVASISKNEAEANAKSKILDKENFQNVSLDYNFVNFRQTGFNDFNFNSRITIRFELAKYKIILGEINRQEADRHSHYAHHDIYRQLGLEQPGYNAPKDEVEPEYEVCEKLYSERISAEEIENIVRIIANLHKEFIESEIEEKIDAKKRAAEFIDWS